LASTGGHEDLVDNVDDAVAGPNVGANDASTAQSSVPKRPDRFATSTRVGAAFMSEA
jgi:hypothetical protein